MSRGAAGGELFFRRGFGEPGAADGDGGDGGGLGAQDARAE